MTVEQAITRFKNACALPENFYQRSIAVAYQFQRNVWEVNDHRGLIRIVGCGNNSKIIVWNVLPKPVFEAEITKDIFDELEKLFKGYFEEDTEYLKRYDHS